MNKLKIVLINLISILISGLGIGWLVGMSVSPVLSIVLTSIVGLISTIIAAFSGLSHQENSNTDKISSSKSKIITIASPLALAILIFGIVFGSLVSNYYRVFVMNPKSILAEINFWTSQGIPKNKVAELLLKHRLEPDSVYSKASTPVLFSNFTAEGRELLAQSKRSQEKFQLSIRRASLKMRKLYDLINEYETFKSVLEILAYEQ